MPVPGGANSDREVQVRAKELNIGGVVQILKKIVKAQGKEQKWPEIIRNHPGNMANFGKYQYHRSMRQK